VEARDAFAAIGAVAEQALDGIRRHGARGDVYVTRTSGLVAEVIKGKLRNSRADGRLDLTVRAVRDGRIGVYSTTDLTDPGRAAAAAIEIASVGEELDLEFPARGGEPGQGTARAPRMLDPGLGKLDAASLVTLVQDIAARVAEVTPGAQVEATGGSSFHQSVLVNSSGGRFQRESTRLEAWLQVSRFAAADVLFMYQGHASARSRDPAFDEIPGRLGGFYAAAAQTASPPSGKTRVVFAPQAVGVLLGPMLAGVNGINVNLGTSPLAGKLGERILDGRFSLTDDPWLDWSPESAVWDDEGVPASPKPVFREGVLLSYLHDLRSAAKGKTSSTGNGRRGRGGPPRIAPFNVMVSPGTHSLQDLLSEAEGGLYIVSVIGGVAGILAGAFSHPVGLAYLIKDGRFAGRVKDVAISGNVYELCRGGLAGLEDRAHPVLSGSSVLAGRAPHILLDGVDVSGH